MKPGTVLLLAAVAGCAIALPASDAHATTVVVAKGETLASIAARQLGDEEAAGELAILNRLPPDAVPRAGTRLKLPGKTRDRAVAAIRRVQSDMRDANSEAGRKAAQQDLDRAYGALRATRYSEAEALAVRAHADLATPTTRVSVTVDPGRKRSRFAVQSGAVEVRNVRGETRADAGEVVEASAGAAPVRKPNPLPPTPSLSAPADGASLAVAPTLRWAGSAAKYRVVVARDARFRERVVSVETTETELAAPVADGTWWWRVEAIDDSGLSGTPSLARSFAVKVPVQPRVDVGAPIFGSGR